MDTPTLIADLRAVTPQALDWRLALYSTHKGRDGIELDFAACPMADMEAFAENLIMTLLQKTIPDRSITEYTPFLPKEVIGCISQDDERMKDALGDIVPSIRSAMEYAAENFVSGVAPSPVGYALYGCAKDEEGKIREEVLFMRRANPFLQGGKAKLCTTQGGKIVESEKPLLKFTSNTDFLLVNGKCYFFSSSIEKDFGLENRYRAICARGLGHMADAGVVSDFEGVEKAAMAAGNARKFVDFDLQILEYIANLPLLERLDFLSAYGITADAEGRMETGDAEQCELVIDLLCGRSCMDALGRLSVGSKITPR